MERMECIDCGRAWYGGNHKLNHCTPCLEARYCALKIEKDEYRRAFEIREEILKNTLQELKELKRIKMSNWLRKDNMLMINGYDGTESLEAELLDKGGIALTIITQSNEAPWEDIRTTKYLFGRELEVLKKFIQNEKFKSCPSIPDSIRPHLGQPLSQRLRQYTQSQIPVHQDMDELIKEIEELEKQSK